MPASILCHESHRAALDAAFNKWAEVDLPMSNIGEWEEYELLMIDFSAVDLARDFVTIVFEHPVSVPISYRNLGWSIRETMPEIARWAAETPGSEQPVLSYGSGNSKDHLYFKTEMGATLFKLRWL